MNFLEYLLGRIVISKQADDSIRSAEKIDDVVERSLREGNRKYSEENQRRADLTRNLVRNMPPAVQKSRRATPQPIRPMDAQIDELTALVNRPDILPALRIVYEKDIQVLSRLSVGNSECPACFKSSNEYVYKNGQFYCCGCQASFSSSQWIALEKTNFSMLGASLREVKCKHCGKESSRFIPVGDEISCPNCQATMTCEEFEEMAREAIEQERLEAHEERKDSQNES